MSATPHAPTYECRYCGAAREPGVAFCSDVCRYRQHGKGILQKVESQSQFCNTCYGRVRDIQPLPEYAPADGFQYRTPLTTIGVDEFRSDHPRIEGTRISCQCGAVNPDGGPIAELQQIHTTTAKANLYRALAWLADHGAIDDAPALGRYTNALAERPHDAAYACGRAIYGDDTDD